jgi:hypothetical protein
MTFPAFIPIESVIAFPEKEKSNITACICHSPQIRVLSIGFCIDPVNLCFPAYKSCRNFALSQYFSLS